MDHFWAFSWRHTSAWYHITAVVVPLYSYHSAGIRQPGILAFIRVAIYEYTVATTGATLCTATTAVSICAKRCHRSQALIGGQPALISQRCRGTTTRTAARRLHEYYYPLVQRQSCYCTRHSPAVTKHQHYSCTAVRAQTTSPVLFIMYRV